MAFFDQAFSPGGGISGLTSPGLNPQLLARILAMQSGQGAATQPGMGGLGALMGAGGPAVGGQPPSAGAPAMPQPPAARPGAVPQPGMPAPQVTPPPQVPAMGGQQSSPLQQLQAIMAMNPQLKQLLQGAGTAGTGIMPGKGPSSAGTGGLY